MSQYQSPSTGKISYPGYEIFQEDLEINYPAVISKSTSESLNILVVGACRGDEIFNFLKWNINVIHAFEPNPETFVYLQKTFDGNSRVHCHQIACSDKNGEATLFSHTASSGTDSLLEAAPTSGLVNQTEWKVKTVRLDDLAELDSLQIDLFWIDVQGFELSVFKGATDILSRTKGIYVEINESELMYKGAVLSSDLKDFLYQQGFYLSHVEMSGDPLKYGGVALFLKNEIQTNYFNQENIDARTPFLLSSINKRDRVRQSLIFRTVSSLLPVSIKARLKKLVR